VSPSFPNLAEQDGYVADRREAFEERAAIMEFDGGMCRAEAEAAAWAIISAIARKARQGDAQ
jgi:hypothetical protein